MKNWISPALLALFIAICLAVSGAGALFTAGSVQEWYPVLQKPAWTPPSWLFGPVWTILYLMMAFAAWLVWRRRKSARVRGDCRIHWRACSISCCYGRQYWPH